jgi:ZIP family zinc transporter
MSGLALAVALGAIGASALLVGAFISLRVQPRHSAVALVMGFGVGAMLSAIAYQLLPDATSDLAVVGGLVAGALVFYAGDAVIDRRGGMSRKAIGEVHPDSEGDAIFLGTLLDGVPESFVLGAGVAMGDELGLAFLLAVFVSNLPEAIAATSSMRESGEPTRRIWFMWASVVVVSAIAAGVGFLLTGSVAGRLGDFVEAFAAGALLVMLVDSMVPEAIRWGSKAVGLATVLGSITSTGLSLLSVK